MPRCMGATEHSTRPPDAQFLADGNTRDEDGTVLAQGLAALTTTSTTLLPGRSPTDTTGFLELLGAFSSAIAIAGGLLALMRRVRARQQRHVLSKQLSELRNLSDELGRRVAAIDQCFLEGFNWAGMQLWNHTPLAPHLEWMLDVIDKLELATARMRGMVPNPNTERLRSDVERCCIVVREAMRLYLEGSISSYQQYGGDPVDLSAGGGEATPALGWNPFFIDGTRLDEFQQREVSLQKFREESLRSLRAEVKLLVRTALYRLGRDGEAHVFAVEWPIARYEMERDAG